VSVSPSSTRKYVVLFLLFVGSGFCGLLYQVIWVRLAFAAFGVITPVLSVVLSVFMLGLALGSWAGGKWIGPLTAKTGRSAIWFYAVVEFLIGVGAFLVPRTFAAGEAWLLQAGDLDSTRYLLNSAIVLCLSLLPWCFFMGTTFPFMMSYVREDERAQRSSFSYLYLANVIGAMCGTLLTALVLIELLGFRHCLMVAGFTNFLIGATAFLLGTRSRYRPVLESAPPKPTGSKRASSPARSGGWLLVAILFATGFASMAMEVVWTRAFTPVLRTTIYAFASLLGVYLFATWVGSLLYRYDLRRRRVQPVVNVLAFLAVSSLLPVLINDPRWGTQLPFTVKAAITLASIFPFCAMLGYLTPRLIDEYSGGAPHPAGTAYAVNIVGCIIGPLFAGYVLLPYVGLRHALVLLSIIFPFFYVCLLPSTRRRVQHAFATLGATTVLVMISEFWVVSYEDGLSYRLAQVRRDHVATVISCGHGLGKELLVNGIGMTQLRTVTKNMAHFPLAIREKKPTSALAICLGMGTTFRSLVSWGIEATAVELVPSVRDAFGYYFDDAEIILRNPKARIVIDDGRRFLKRTTERFDLITIDPPPPPEAAGSSLLYSEEFYRLLSTRLKQGGMLQQWSPPGNKTIVRAKAKAIRAVFPYVRVFYSIARWGSGYHFFASTEPFDMPTVQAFVSRLPPTAAADLLEWSRYRDPAVLYKISLQQEIPLDRILTPDATSTITDDRPFNEYFLLRRLSKALSGTDAVADRDHF